MSRRRAPQLLAYPWVDHLHDLFSSSSEEDYVKKREELSSTVHFLTFLKDMDWIDYKEFYAENRVKLTSLDPTNTDSISFLIDLSGKFLAALRSRRNREDAVYSHLPASLRHVVQRDADISENRGRIQTYLEENAWLLNETEEESILLWERTSDPLSSMTLTKISILETTTFPFPASLPKWQIVFLYLIREKLKATEDVFKIVYDTLKAAKNLEDVLPTTQSEKRSGTGGVISISIEFDPSLDLSPTVLMDVSTQKTTVKDLKYLLRKHHPSISEDEIALVVVGLEKSDITPLESWTLHECGVTDLSPKIQVLPLGMTIPFHLLFRSPFLEDAQIRQYFLKTTFYPSLPISIAQYLRNVEYHGIENYLDQVPTSNVDEPIEKSTEKSTSKKVFGAQSQCFSFYFLEDHKYRYVLPSGFQSFWFDILFKSASDKHEVEKALDLLESLQPIPSPKVLESLSDAVVEELYEVHVSLSKRRGKTERQTMISRLLDERRSKIQQTSQVFSLPSHALRNFLQDVELFPSIPVDALLKYYLSPEGRRKTYAKKQSQAVTIRAYRSLVKEYERHPDWSPQELLTEVLEDFPFPPSLTKLDNDAFLHVIYSISYLGLPEESTLKRFQNSTLLFDKRAYVEDATVHRRKLEKAILVKETVPAPKGEDENVIQGALYLVLGEKLLHSIHLEVLDVERAKEEKWLGEVIAGDNYFASLGFQSFFFRFATEIILDTENFIVLQKTPLVRVHLCFLDGSEQIFDQSVQRHLATFVKDRSLRVLPSSFADQWGEMIVQDSTEGEYTSLFLFLVTLYVQKAQSCFSIDRHLEARKHWEEFTKQKVFQASDRSNYLFQFANALVAEVFKTNRSTIRNVLYRFASFYAWLDETSPVFAFNGALLGRLEAMLFRVQEMPALVEMPFFFFSNAFFSFKEEHKAHVLQALVKWVETFTIRLLDQYAQLKAPYPLQEHIYEPPVQSTSEDITPSSALGWMEVPRFQENVLPKDPLEPIQGFSSYRLVESLRPFFRWDIYDPSSIPVESISHKDFLLLLNFETYVLQELLHEDTQN